MGGSRLEERSPDEENDLRRKQLLGSFTPLIQFKFCGLVFVFLCVFFF